MFYYHIRSTWFISPQKLCFTFSQQYFLIELHPERDHTKLHQVWHDTLAPT